MLFRRWFTATARSMSQQVFVRAAAAAGAAAELRESRADREAAQSPAGWREHRPQLGREVLSRGLVEPAASAELATAMTDLPRSCLKLLEVPPKMRAAAGHGGNQNYRAEAAVAVRAYG